MPIVDLAAPPITSFAGRPEDFAVTPGKDEVDHGSDTPERIPTMAGTDTPDVGGVDPVLASAFRQGNVIGSALSRQDLGANLDREPGFNPWDAIKGTKYEPYWNSFVDIRSTAGADARKRQIDMEDEDRRTLAGAPWYKSLPAQLLAGAADLPSLLPGGAFVRGAGGGISIARTAAVTGAAAGVAVAGQEAGLHATQELRTGAESAMNIGTSVLLAGLLGAGGAKLLSRAEWNKGVAGLNRDLGRAAPPPFDTGAPHIDAVLSHPDVASAIENPKINRTQDVPYTAGPDNTGPGLNIDRHFPESFTIEQGPALVVARRRADGTVRYGKPGDVHSDLMSRAELNAAGPTPPEIEEAMGWARPGGKFMSRDEALEFGKRNEPGRVAHSLEQPEHGLEAATYNEGKSTVTWDPAEPFAVHEFSERHAMNTLTAGGMDEATAYKVAHWEVAEPAEGKWYETHGINQDKAEAAYQPYIDQIEHEKLARGDGDVPAELFKKPYPHDNVDAAAREKAPVPKPTPEEIARGREILAKGQRAPEAPPPFDTGAPHIDAVLSHPDVASAIENPKINRTQDVPYTAGPDKTGPGLNIDRHFPESFTVDDQGNVRATSVAGYHGTDAEITEPDVSFGGTRGGIPDERGTVFFSSTEKLAGMYGNNVIKKDIRLGKTAEFDAAQLINDPQFVEDMRASFERTATRNDQLKERAGTPEGRAAIEKGWQGVLAKIEEWKQSGHVRYNPALSGAIIERAKAQGLDTAVIKNMAEGHGKASDQVVVLNNEMLKPGTGGKTFDPAQPFAVHEFSERHAINQLIAGGMDEATAYKVAHWEVAEPAEGKWYETHGIDQAKAEAAYQPYIDQIEHEKLARGDGDVPAELFKKPYPHDNVDAAAREKAPVPKPTPEEIARGREILAKGQRAPEAQAAAAGAPASAGAAAHEPIGIEGNAIAGRAAGAVAAATRSLNPLLRLMQSPSAAVRDVAGKLFENSLYLKKNFEGVASEPAVETLMKEWNGGLARALQSTEGAWRDYRKAGGQLDGTEFREAVSRAMRRGDESDIPQVAAVAKAWRSQVFNPLKEAAIKAGLLPEDVSVDTAISYFSRMWNRNRLIGQRGRFTRIVSDYYSNVIGKEYEKATAGFNARMAKLDQEAEDLNLAPEQRAQRLGELETAAEEHEAAGAAYQDLSEKADRLADIAAEQRRLKDLGDTMVARQNMAAAKAETAAIKEAGGKDLADFIARRSELRTRRRNVDLGAAGLAERSQQVMESLADLEEATQRSLGRLVKKGQALERDLDRLDPDVLAERVSALKDNFAEIARRSDAAAERATKAVEGMREGAAKARESGAVLGAEAGQKMDELVAARLEKEAAAQRARSERMSRIAERLEVAEGFDRDGAVAELRAGVEKAIAETSHTTLARGERAQRLQERLAALDPQRIEDRTDAITQMKKDIERAYYDRWEVKNLGKGVDPAAKDRPDFSDAARDIADNVYNTLTGRTEAGVRPEFAAVSTRGPMKDRTFNIPDELVEDFLEHDVEHVGKRYVRVMGADVEMAHKFGSVDMKDQLADIRANYDRMQAALPDGPEKLALGKQHDADVEDMTALRDLMRGTRQEAPWERSWSKIVRNAGYLNYVRTMGEIVLGNFNDAVRPAMVHGLMPYMRTMGQLATNLSAIKMSVEEARLAGNVAERVLASRMATLTDMADPYASRGPIEAFLENMSNRLSKWNGIRLWNDMQKSITAVMTQDRILRGVENFAGTKDKPYLAFMGIDQSMAERIQAQFTAHGENVEGVRVANTEAWTDPVAVRTYRAAMNKDIDSIIVTAGKADLPLFVHTPTGKVLAQFQGYTLASHQRILLRGLQESPTRFIGGVVANTAMGMAIVYLKALSANRTDKLESMSDNPGWWIAEGFDRAGVVAVPVELSNRMEKLTGFNPIKTPMKMFDKGGAESQKNENHDKFGGMLGPSVGLGEDLATVAGIPQSVYQGKDVSKAQKNAAVRLMPLQSYYGVRQMMNYVVNPPH